MVPEQAEIPDERQLNEFNEYIHIYTMYIHVQTWYRQVYTGYILCIQHE